MATKNMVAGLPNSYLIRWVVKIRFAYSCDIVRNNNPKSKRFGQHGIVLTTFELCENIGDEVVYNRGHWGNLKLVDVNDNIRILNHEKMWELAGKYIRHAAVVV